MHFVKFGIISRVVKFYTN